MRQTTVPLGLCSLVVLLFVAGSRTLAADPPAKANLKLLTWNIQMLPTFAFGNPDVNKGQAMRAPWIVDYLGGQDFDVVCLQEVIDRKITEELKRGLQKHYPYVVATPSKKGIAGCTGGILFVARVPIKYIAHIVYKNVAGVDAMAEKGCVLVEADVNGVPVQIAGTHLQAGHRQVRVKEFPEIYEGIIKPYAREGVPQLLVGDMNVASNLADEIAMFQDLLKTTEMREYPTDDPQPFSVDGINSWNNNPRKKPERIDHVLLNPRSTSTTILRQTIQRARQQHDGRTIDLADHYGVIAEILVQK